MALRLKYPVILASASPRRQELLKRLIPEFAVVPAEVDEEAHTHEDPYVTAQGLARRKAFEVFERHPNSLVIGGDTVVAFEEAGSWTQLAKPTDVDDAVRMLTLLAGRTHLVVTGMALRWPRGMHAFTAASNVTFRPLNDAEIRAYVATGEPMDKAGAYGIQGMAKGFLERLEGSVDTVIGMPIEPLEEALKDVK
ncbi:MAG: septum formation protein Maf [Chthonomonas sp.]|nr:septum formation protein Maf [Chthonomonas sp.]